MCRIAGMIDRALPTETIKNLVTGMSQILKGGGPDGEGIYCDDINHLVLGHRRLSLIDLSDTSHQPMPYANERYWISYNGELYNYLELKKELIRAGCRFTSTGDTEVILAAFATWGTDAFSKFNGMFAFALWDSYKTDLYLVRDASGIKPLFYSISKQGLVFASEVKAFKNIPGLQKANPHWEVYLMAYGHLPEPITTLHNVKPLQKGNWLVYNTASGIVHQDEFLSYTYSEKIKNRKEAIELVRSSFHNAVERHLLSDAPIGVFLSGGIDSSIIALLANEHEADLKTVSLCFEQEQFSEKKYQDTIQSHLNCNHHQHLLKEDEFHEYFPSIISSMDLPSCDGLNTWFISKYAKESGLKAVLSGIGGDELFGGYPSFKRIDAALLLQKLPSAVLRNGKFILPQKYKRVSYLSIDGPIGIYLFMRGQYVPNEIAAHLGSYEKDIWNILSDHPPLPNIDMLSSKNKASWVETNMYLQNQLLRDADVMSMSHGVEIRVPFLDAEFIKTALQIHSNVKYSGKLPKQLLIDSFKDILPESVWNRPKMGFTFPFREWLQNSPFATHLMCNDKSNAHQKFSSNQMHWSQYLTAMLIAHHNNA